MRQIKINSVMSNLLNVARSVLVENTECFTAQWVLQNPDEPTKEWVLCHQADWATGEHRYWMEKK